MQSRGQPSQLSIPGQEFNCSSHHPRPPPTSSSPLQFTDALLSQSPPHATLQNGLIQTHHQASSQAPGGGENGSEFMNLQQILGFGMGAYNLPGNPQLLQGLQGSVNSPKGSGAAVAESLQGTQGSSQAFMNALALLQKNIEHLQTLVQMIAQGGQLSAPTTQQQMKAAAGMATVISQLIAVAAGLLPEVHQQSPHSTYNFAATNFGAEDILKMDIFQQNSSDNSFAAALEVLTGSCPFSSYPGEERHNAMDMGCSVGGNQLDRSLEFAEVLAAASHQISVAPGSSSRNHVGVDLGLNSHTDLDANMASRRCSPGINPGNHAMLTKSHEINGSAEDQNPGNGFRDDDDEDEVENLPAGSYDLIELEAMEILAEHTHFCEVCGKGFKRDANLRMHMRGHGDEYKTAAALAKPDKFDQDASQRRLRRYSCPFLGCKRNKKHKKFVPLKTMLCVKNHYRRSHCPKILTCNKCKVKTFSVVADLKTHEKHCGREKWQCSCGTTFSRKDKLLGHVVLFLGHTPATRLTQRESLGSVEKVKNEMGSSTGNMTSNGSRRLIISKASAALGASNGSTYGSGHDSGVGSDMKPENVRALVLGGKDSSLLGARLGRTNLDWRDSNKLSSGIMFSDSENSGGISGSQVSTLSSFKQAGVSLSARPSSLHGLFGSNYDQDPNGPNPSTSILD